MIAGIDRVTRLPKRTPIIVPKLFAPVSGRDTEVTKENSSIRAMLQVTITTIHADISKNDRILRPQCQRKSRKTVPNKDIRLTAPRDTMAENIPQLNVCPKNSSARDKKLVSKGQTSV